MAAPHAIHEEFPNDAERIHALKVSDAHFARLLDEYDSVNDEVAGAESRQTPMSDEAEQALRKALENGATDRMAAIDTAMTQRASTSLVTSSATPVVAGVLVSVSLIQTIPYASVAQRLETCPASP